MSKVGRKKRRKRKILKVKNSKGNKSKVKKSKVKKKNIKNFDFKKYDTMMAANEKMLAVMQEQTKKIDNLEKQVRNGFLDAASRAIHISATQVTNTNRILEALCSKGMWYIMVLCCSFRFFCFFHLYLFFHSV